VFHHAAQRTARSSMSSSVVASRGMSSLGGGMAAPDLLRRPGPSGPVRAGSFGGSGVRDLRDRPPLDRPPLAPPPGGRLSSQSYGALHRERGASEGAQRNRNSYQLATGDVGLRPGLRPEGLFPSFPVTGENSRDADRSIVDAMRRRQGAPPLLPHPPTGLPGQSAVHSYGHLQDDRSSGGGDSAGSASRFRSDRDRPHTPSGTSSIGSSAHAPLRPGGPGGRDAFFGSGSRSAGEASARSLSAAATPSNGHGGSSNSSSAGGVTCDKCDGRHITDQCPHYRREREKHKDAWANYGRKGQTLGMGGSGGHVLRNARVVRQPGDGSCLFHSMNYGFGGGGGGAMSLRREIANFLEHNPQLQIAGDSLEDWVKWDANSSVTAYARRMATGGWGGGIEMACCSRLKNVNIHVYENKRGGSEYKCISCFDSASATRTIHVLYQGGVHYDALIPS